MIGQYEHQRGIYMNRNIDFTVGPYQLALDITNKCNLRCLHCYNASGENRVM